MTLKDNTLVFLCLYVADPATSLASNSVLGTLIPSANSLFILLRKRVCVMTLILTFFSKTTQCPFKGRKAKTL